MSESWTVGRLLQWTTDYLKQRDSESPRLDAEVLLAKALGCQRIQLYTRFAEEPPDDARAAFREFVRQRAEGMPVAYLVGSREFYSLSFRVTPDVLIPRPETEFVVVRLLDLVREYGPAAGPIDVADLGTGSGILAVCAARRLERARVVAVDVSPAALAVARSNADDHRVAERIEFIESDWFAALPPDRRFDYIVSNPPYVATGELAALRRDVLTYEPRLALEAGPHGTEALERLLPQAADRLRAGGWLLVEISPQLDAPARNLLAGDARWELYPTLKDLAGHPRVLQARRRAPSLA